MQNCDISSNVECHVLSRSCFHLLQYPCLWFILGFNYWPLMISALEFTGLNVRSWPLMEDTRPSYPFPAEICKWRHGITWIIVFWSWYDMYGKTAGEGSIWCFRLLFKTNSNFVKIAKLSLKDTLKRGRVNLVLNLLMHSIFYKNFCKSLYTIFLFSSFCTECFLASLWTRNPNFSDFGNSRLVNRNAYQESYLEIFCFYSCK